MAHAAGRGKGTGANMAASLARPHTGPEPAFGHTAPASHQFRAGGAQVLPAIQGAPNEPRPRKGIGESNEAEDDDTDDFGVATAAISGNGEEGGVDVADANGEPDEAMPLYKGTSEEEASLSSSAVGASGSPAQPQPPLADSKTPPHWATMDYRGVGNDEKDGDVSVEPAAGIGGDGSGADGPPSAAAAAALMMRNPLEKRESLTQHHLMVAAKMKSKAKQRQSEAKARIRKRMFCLIRPRNPHKVAWDMWVGVLIVYSVLIIPFRIAYNVKNTGTWWMWLDYTIDFFFFVDMALCFFTAFYNDDDKLVSDHYQIAKHYAQTWLVPDFLSTLPIGLFEVQCGDGGFMSSFKLLKALRFIRLLKLMRLLRLGRKIKQIKTGLNPNFARLLKLFMIIVFIAHMISCAWFLIRSSETTDSRGEVVPPSCAVYEPEDESNCAPTPVPTPWSTSPAPTVMTSYWTWQKCGGETPKSKYFASFYWTIATMMAVGYGDISASKPEEMIFAIFTQMAGAIAFGFIIATVTSIVETFDPYELAKKRRLEEVREFASEQFLTTDLQRKIGMHLTYFYAKGSVYNEAFLLSQLPEALRCRFIFSTKASFIQSFHLFEHLNIQFVCDISACLKPMLLSFKERLGHSGDVSDEMYFVVKGKLQMFRGEEPGDVRTQINISMNQGAASPHRRNNPAIVLVGIFLQGADIELDSVLNCKPMVASYVAATQCDLVWLEQRDLWRFISRYPQVLPLLNRRVSEQQARLKKVLASPLRQAPELFIAMKENIVVDNEVVDLQTALDVLGDLQATAQSSFSRPGMTKRRTYKDVTTPSAPSAAGGAAGADAGGEVGGAADDQALREETFETPEDLLARGIIDPMYRRKIQWDMYIGVVTIISVIIVPLRLGFPADSEPATFTWGRFTLWYVFDWIVNPSFWLDVLVCFCTAYEDATTGVLVTDHKSIAKDYLQSWFAIDVVSSVPLDDIKVLKVFKMLKLIRLFKLVRLLKLRKLKNVTADGSNMHANTGATRWIAVCFQLFFVAHLFACFWTYLSIEQRGVPEDGELASCEEGSGHRCWWKDPPESGISLNMADNTFQDKLDRYVAALYWAFTTMTTVGYGDILPTTDEERFFATCLMFLGATFFGYIVGVVRDLAHNPNGATARERVLVSATNAYMTEQNIDSHLRRAVKRQVQFWLQQRSAFDGESVLRVLPKQLRRDVILQSHISVFPIIPIFRAQGRRFTAHIIRLMRPLLALQSYEVYRSGVEASRGLYFVVNGMVEMTVTTTVSKTLTDVAGKIMGGINQLPSESGDVKVVTKSTGLGVGKFFGHIPLLGRREPNISVRAVSETQMYVLPVTEWDWLHRCRPTLAARITQILADCEQEQDEAVGSPFGSDAGSGMFASQPSPTAGARPRTPVTVTVLPSGSGAAQLQPGIVGEEPVHEGGSEARAIDAAGDAAPAAAAATARSNHGHAHEHIGDVQQPAEPNGESGGCASGAAADTPATVAAATGDTPSLSEGMGIDVVRSALVEGDAHDRSVGHVADSGAPTGSDPSAT